MEYVNRLMENSRYKELLEQIEQYEKQRIYCKHGISHLLDVARIAYLLNLEYQLGLDKEVIYVTALLHDTGRLSQYQGGVNHEFAGASIGKELLEDIQYPTKQRGWIVDHILDHRQIVEQKDDATEENIIALADKLSRNCYSCKANDTCYWKEDKRTKEVRW